MNDSGELLIQRKQLLDGCGISLNAKMSNDLNGIWMVHFSKVC